MGVIVNIPAEPRVQGPRHRQPGLAQALGVLTLRFTLPGCAWNYPTLPACVPCAASRQAAPPCRARARRGRASASRQRRGDPTPYRSSGPPAGTPGVCSYSRRGGVGCSRTPTRVPRVVFERPPPYPVHGPCVVQDKVPRPAVGVVEGCLKILGNIRGGIGCPRPRRT